MRPVQGDVPLEIPVLEDVGADLKLDACVLHIHIVDELAVRRTLAEGKRPVINHVLGHLYEEIRIYADPVEKAALEAGVEIAGLFPGHVRGGAEYPLDGRFAVHSLH